MKMYEGEFTCDNCHASFRNDVASKVTTQVSESPDGPGPIFSFHNRDCLRESRDRGEKPRP
jgi:hypothetical protein